MIALIPLLTLIAALGSGLMAGLFFAFSSFIMTALAKLPPEQGIAAMNSINVTILNATFGLAFFGTALLCLGLGVASILRWAEPGLGMAAHRQPALPCRHHRRHHGVQRSAQ